MNRVARGDALLNRLVQSGKLSKSGVAAFLAAVDPYHDEQIEGLCGWPDLEVAPSVVRCIPFSQTVKALEDGAAIVVMTHPIMNPRVMNAITRRNGIVDTVSDQVSTNSSIAPAVVYQYTKAQWDSGSLPLYAATSPILATFAPRSTDLNDGPTRCIGFGVEVHDVTAEIYKQGTITVAEIPQSLDEREVFTIRAQTVNSNPYAQTTTEVVPIERSPISLANAMLYPSTVQWAAKEGCYAVIPFTGQPNTPVVAEYRTPTQNVTAVTNDRVDTLNTGPRVLGAYATGSPSGDNFVFQPNMYSPQHSKAILISGLNANSTFTINMRYYLETFPISASDLSTLARPSAKYDSAALQLISAAMKKLPVAVPVGDNPDGEWFWDTLQAALPYIGGFGATMFPEFSPLIAAGTAAADSALTRRKRKAERKKEHVPAPVNKGSLSAITKSKT